jgi:N-acetylmuramoyl-L-alanine amidase
MVEPASPVQEGNRVLESIAQRDALRALLAFSDLHEEIRDRRLSPGGCSDKDLFETERFILDEVLQLICDRAQVLTQADGVVIALPEKSSADGLKQHPGMVTRASSGTLAVDRGVHLIGESEFLQDCLESGRILRCDDCEIDARAELDFSRAIGARSTVLVPLHGHREQLGVLQALSSTAWAFTDNDIRCLDLFAELVLSALKPEDEDRRIHWLSGVAENILQAKSPAAEVVAPAAEVVAPVVAEFVATAAELTAPNPPEIATPAPLESTAEELPKTIEDEPKPAVVASTVALPATPEIALPSLPTPNPFSHDLSSLTEPVSIPVETLCLKDAVAADAPAEADDAFDLEELPTALSNARVLSFPERLAVSTSARPGLSVVMGLVAVAALFSAGLWWGMQVHGKATPKSVAATTETALQPVTAPSVPPAAVLSISAPDNLMNAAKLGSEDAQLMPVPESKLAGLPRITGVRHWSSSMGSTVVIDMEDNVPYEVHRLMSPERIYFDLHDTVLSPELDGKTMDVGDAALTRVRVAQPVAGVTRIVLDTKDGSNFSVSMESSPYRLVVELRSGNERLFAGNGPAPSRTESRQNTALNSTPAKTAPAAALAAKASDQPVPARTGKFRIVLDAGHGGWDLGTVGRQGLLEKDLVLDVTQRLGKLLQSRLGLDVMFTRSGDSYLALDQRADFANQTQADLFVSVHANYSNLASARGVETYYTNTFAAPGSKEAEKHDDGTFAKMTPVSLTAGGLHEKIEESRRLATSVQRALYATLAASSPDIRNRGIKDASYVVLTGTTMPAILTEISFVSSPEDERKLQNPAYRQQIAEALYKGIAGYQQSAPHSKIAQLQKPR